MEFEFGLLFCSRGDYGRSSAKAGSPERRREKTNKLKRNVFSSLSLPFVNEGMNEQIEKRNEEMRLKSCAANKMNEIAFLVFFFLCGLRAAAAALLRKEKTNEDKKKSN